MSNALCEEAILLIDDDFQMRSTIANTLTRGGYRVEVAPSLRKASELAAQPYRLILLDEALPGESSVHNVQKLRSTHADAPVLLLTDQSTRLSTMEMIGDQIAGYQSKPLDLNALAASVEKLIQDAPRPAARPSVTSASSAPRNGSAPSVVIGPTRRKPAATGPQQFLLGETAAIRNVRRQIAEVANTDMTVLIRGESGVGKGVVARMIHEHSLRCQRHSLITINCPAIPESLMESELFGHEAGAFTGANNAKPGRIELANSGTVFLDEIAEIPPTMQVKLLQVIENKELYHLGGKQPIHVDVRFLAATNANLESMIGEQKFRADLFYRINEFSIQIPPVRERLEDIPLLIEHFLQAFSQKMNCAKPEVDSELLGAMMEYGWPGNVRELEMVIQRFVVSGRREVVLQAIRHTPAVPESREPQMQSLLHRKEIQMILSALLQTHWNQRKAAKLLGISYSALRRRIEKYGLKNNSAVSISANGSPDSLELTFSARL